MGGAVRTFRTVISDEDEVAVFTSILFRVVAVLAALAHCIRAEKGERLLLDGLDHCLLLFAEHLLLDRLPDCGLLDYRLIDYGLIEHCFLLFAEELLLDRLLHCGLCNRLGIQEAVKARVLETIEAMLATLKHATRADGLKDGLRKQNALDAGVLGRIEAMLPTLEHTTRADGLRFVHGLWLAF